MATLVRSDWGVPMTWLRFALPLEDEIEVEKQVRQIRACSDIEELRDLAEQSFRALALKTYLVSQLGNMVAKAETANLFSQK